MVTHGHIILGQNNPGLDNSYIKGRTWATVQIASQGSFCTKNGVVPTIANLFVVAGRMHCVLYLSESSAQLPPYLNPDVEHVKDSKHVNISNTDRDYLAQADRIACRFYQWNL